MVLVKCKLSNGSYAKILRILHVISTVIAKITMRGRPFFYETNLGHILIVVVKKLYLVDRHRYNRWAALSSKLIINLTDHFTTIFQPIYVSLINWQWITFLAILHFILVLLLNLWFCTYIFMTFQSCIFYRYTFLSVWKNNTRGY